MMPPNTDLDPGPLTCDVSFQLSGFDLENLYRALPPAPVAPAPLVTLVFQYSWRRRLLSWPWRPWVTGTRIVARGGFAVTSDLEAYEFGGQVESHEETYANWWPKHWRTER